MKNNYSEKFEKMRVAGKLASKTLDMITELLNQIFLQIKLINYGYEFIRDNGGHSAPLFIVDLQNLYVLL